MRNLNLLELVDKQAGSVRLYIIVFLIALAGYGVSRVAPMFDSRFVVHTADSFLHGNGGALDEYAGVLKQEDFYITEKIDGQVRSAFPIGTSLLVSPFVAIYELIIPGFHEQLKSSLPRIFDKAVSGFFGALAAALFCWLVWIIFGCARLAAFGAGILAFGTSMWSTASLSLWQHAPIVVMLIVAMILLFEGQHRQYLLRFVSIPLAFAFIIRPSAAIFIVALSSYVFLKSRREFAFYMVFAALIALPWLAFNFHIYHSLFPAYYQPARLATHTFWEALAGVLMSPARGLFVYSPFLLFAGVGFWVSLRDRDARALNVALFSICVAYWLLIASFPDWYGGHSYGPRYMTDVLPILVYFFLQAFLQAGRLMRPTMLAMVLIGIVVNGIGATNTSGYVWNVDPTNINSAPERLWDWSDPPFMRIFQLRRTPPMIGEL